MATEGIELEFEDDGVVAIADVAARVNERSADIGARRLQTVMERLLDELSFESPDLGAQRVVIDAKMVEDRLGELVEDQDLSQYIL
jgi:ATP-dependent HslUV protease ATP-binding subunit HslU